MKHWKQKAIGKAGAVLFTAILLFFNSASYGADVSLVGDTTDATITGDHNYNGGTLGLPTNAGVPSGTQDEGDAVFDTTNDELYISEGGGTWGKVATSFPAGILTPYAGSSAPTGWLLCYGQSISKTTYPDLWDAIGYTYGGSGDNFNVPDMRGRILAGLDNLGASSANRLTGSWADGLGGNSGAETHTLSTSEIPAHNHDILNDQSGGSFATPSIVKGNGAYYNTYTTENTGGGGSHNNVQPTIAVSYIIKY